MLIPAEQDLVGVRGASWDASFQLWADEGETVPFDLSVYETLELEIDQVATLTAAAGLTVTAAQGLVEAVLTAEQAERPFAESSAYRLRCTRSDGGVDFPVHGLVRWTEP